MVLASVKLLFQALYREEQILSNPARDIVIKNKSGDSCKAYFTVSEINRFLDAIDIEKPLGLRDRAIFELVYSSALRVSEVSKLDMNGIDFEERMIMIRQRKFSKDRRVHRINVSKQLPYSLYRRKKARAGIHQHPEGQAWGCGY